MRRLSCAAVIGSVFLLSGCAAVRPDAFRGFQSSVVAAQKGLETEMLRDVNWTREADVQELANDKNAPLSGHMVKDTAGYRWTTDVRPPHRDARRTLRALGDLNAAFGTYVQLLNDAATGQLNDEEYFSGFADSLNEELRDLKETLSGLRPGDKGPVAALSAFAAEGLRRFIESRRAEDLRRAVRENQPLVEGYARHCGSLIGLIRADLKAAYGDQIQAIQERWDDKRSPGRVTLTRSLFNLNEEYADAMDSLESLEVFYNALPAAHKDLAEFVARPRTPRKALSDLARSAERVARRTNELEKSR